MPIAGHECAAEALRLAAPARSAPLGARDALFLRGRTQDREQLAMIEVGA